MELVRDVLDKQLVSVSKNEPLGMADGIVIVGAMVAVSHYQVYPGEKNMTRRRVHLERLIGKKVLDPSNRSAGRIEEIRARELKSGECVVEEYHLGRAGLWERLSLTGPSGLFVHLLGGHTAAPSHVVPWDKMDLSDPEHPRITCPAQSLGTISPR